MGTGHAWTCSPTACLGFDQTFPSSTAERSPATVVPITSQQSLSGTIGACARAAEMPGGGSNWMRGAKEAVAKLCRGDGGFWG